MSVARPPEPFEDFYARLHPRVLGFAVGVVGDLHDAADVTDEAFSRALAAWDRIGGTAAPEAWVFTVARNVARRRARRRAVEQRLLGRFRERPPGDDGSAVELEELLGALPARQRTAMALRIFGDLTQAQIAEIMGVRRGTVSSALADAARTLQQQVDRELQPREAQA
jgi:RNA polymerase sigma-70 factor (ECF subfamily)